MIEKKVMHSNVLYWVAVEIYYQYYSLLFEDHVLKMTIANTCQLKMRIQQKFCEMTL